MALTPYPILPPSLIKHTVSVDEKHHERGRSLSVSLPGLSFIPYPILPPSPINLTVSVDVYGHDEKEKL